MSVILKQEFEQVLHPLGKNAAEFFMAASLYHAQQVSFAAAAALANLSFDEFLSRLREHFKVGFFVADQTIQKDLANVQKLLSKS